MLNLNEWLAKNPTMLNSQVEEAYHGNKLYGLKFTGIIQPVFEIDTSQLDIESNYPKPCDAPNCKGGVFLKRNGHTNTCYRCNGTGSITYDKAKKNLEYQMRSGK